MRPGRRSGAFFRQFSVHMDREDYMRLRAIADRTSKGCLKRAFLKWLRETVP